MPRSLFLVKSNNHSPVNLSLSLMFQSIFSLPLNLRNVLPEEEFKLSVSPEVKGVGIYASTFFATGSILFEGIMFPGNGFRVKIAFPLASTAQAGLPFVPQVVAGS